MGLGILDVGDNESIPGTNSMVRDELIQRNLTQTSHERAPQIATSSSRKIALIPQPADDPNDPLNWPLCQRDLMFGILCLMSAFAVSNGSNIAQDLVLLADYFKRSYGDIALLSAYLSCGCGVAGAFIVPVSRIWGQRPLYFLGSLIITVSCLWAGQSKSYNHLFWARILQGVGTAPFEALMSVTVSDLYFVHQRGTRMSILNLFLIGSGFFSPVMGGWVTHGLSWRWVFHLVAIFSGIVTVLIFFFAPESTYLRDQQSAYSDSPTDRNWKNVLSPKNVTKNLGRSNPIMHPDGSRGMDMAISSKVSEDATGEFTYVGQSYDTPSLKARTPFVTRLSLFHGRRIEENFMVLWSKLFIRPFILLLHPPILWMVILMGSAVSWTVFTGIVLAISFPQPPLSFNEVQIGYMYFAAIIGAILGFLLCVFTSDPLASFMAARNKGVYEPEFRIVLVVPMTLFGFVGLFGFGMATGDLEKYGWFWPAFFFASQVISMITACVATSSYIIDAYADISIEAFVMFMIFKNFFLFLLSSKAVGWLVSLGTLRIFEILAGIQVALCLSSIPLYIFGKRLRLFLLNCELFKFSS